MLEMGQNVFRALDLYCHKAHSAEHAFESEHVLYTDTYTTKFIILTSVLQCNHTRSSGSNLRYHHSISKFFTLANLRTQFVEQSLSCIDTVFKAVNQMAN